MARNDDDLPLPKPASLPTHQIGQELGPLSMTEIDTRIALLEAEIERLREARIAKDAVKRAADSIFRL